MDLDAVLGDVRMLVECESPTADRAAVARSADVVAQLGARRLGATPERLVVDGRTHLRWRFGDGDRLLLLGHHDTVWPLGTLDTHPWRVAAGRAFGPGVFDMKAGLVQMFHALAAAADLDGVTVLVTGDEELGAPTSRGLVEEEAGRAGTVLVFEGAADGGALKTARKGAAHYDIRVHGRAAHAGLDPRRGVNATVEAAHVVLQLAELDGTLQTSTVTPTLLASGSTGNTVPAEASIRVDVRTAVALEQRRIDAQIRALAPSLPGASLVIGTTSEHPPFEARSSAALMAVAVEVAGELGLAPLEGAAVGGASDGNYAAATGARTLDGLGAVGGRAHAPGEFVVVAQVPDRIRLAAGLVRRLLAPRTVDSCAAPSSGSGR
jgi:glutamate carboxypeptidase